MVPITVPGRVCARTIVSICDLAGVRLDWRDISVSLANPKSSTFTIPSGRSMMLSGLMSRWTIPATCAACRAPAV